MNKAVTITLALATLLLAAGSALLWQRYHTLETRYSSVKSSDDATQLRYGDALSAIAEIQDSLSTLGVSEATRPILPGSAGAERGLSVLRGREALDRIALLKAGIERTKVRLEDLERRARLSKVRIAGLEHVIENLKREVSEHEAVIAALQGSVDSLHTAVSGLQGQVAAANETVQQHESTIAEQKRELGTVYYVIGDKNHLTKSGAVVARGGIFGLCTALVPASTAREDVFRPLDTDAETVLRIPSPKAQVLSAQPASSYSLTSVGKEVELRILDPHAFRTVRHLVILSQS